MEKTEKWKELLEEFFVSLCEEYNLKHGDISPLHTVQLDNIIERFIENNK